jgi:hypothetical protein
MTELTSPARQVAVIMCVIFMIACLPAESVFFRLLDTVHLGLVLHAVYWYTVSTYGEAQDINYVIWYKDAISWTRRYGAHIRCRSLTVEVGVAVRTQICATSTRLHEMHSICWQLWCRGEWFATCLYF